MPGQPANETDLLKNNFRPTVHNAFDPNKAPNLTSVLQSVSSVEIDFWDDEIAPFFGARPHAWFVRHFPAFGNVSNGRPPGDLRACLLDIRDHLSRNPAPYGAFVFLDKQQGWGGTRQPNDLDALLVELFGNSIFRPVDLLGTATTVREAVLQHGWCSLRRLSGCVCFVLTGGRWGDDQLGANGVLATYVDRQMENGVCFVAPEVRQESEILGVVPGFSALATQWVVMFNNSNNYLHLSEPIHQAGFLSRVYFAANSDDTYQRCISERVNFIAIDAFEERNWNNGLMTGLLPN